MQKLLCCVVERCSAEIAVCVVERCSAEIFHLCLSADVGDLNSLTSIKYGRQ